MSDPLRVSAEIKAISFADEQIRRRLDGIAYQVNRAIRSPLPEAVHDLRVSIRRAEQGLTAFKGFLVRKSAKKTRRKMKEVLDLAGAVRDYDIALQILAKHEAIVSPALQKEFEAQRKDAQRSLTATLRQTSVGRTPVFADREISGTPEAQELARTAAERVLRRSGKRFLNAGAEVLSHRGSMTRVHDFRLVAKKFRYTIELFAPLYQSMADEQLRRIKPIQKLLGDINDYESVQAMVKSFGSHPKLQRALKRTQLRRLRRFRELWSEQFSGDAGREWLLEFRKVLKPEPLLRKPIAKSAAAGGESRGLVRTERPSARG